MRNTIKKIALTVTAVAAVGGLAACGDSNEDAFMEVVVDAGIDPTLRDIAIAAGRSTCDSLDAGLSVPQVTVIALESGLTAEQAGALVGAAVGAFCPKHSEQVQFYSEMASEILTELE